MLSLVAFSTCTVISHVFFGLAIAKSSHPHAYTWNTIARRDDGDETDHSDIQKWGSFGDSFAAGIGAGDRLKGWGDWYCSRYSDSYPSVLSRSAGLGSDFKYFACSGAVTTDVKKQVSGTNGLQMATLSIGGNDANLKDILHACIYQWNKDPQLDCDKTLADSQTTIDDPKFASNLDDAFNQVKGTMVDGNAKIYWTAYSHFWDTSTNQCDSVTWSFKYNIGNRQYLTQDRRTTMNNLVDAVNQKIQDAVGRTGGQAIYVPWGPDVDYIGGHYCEPGVDEWKALDREQTAFYEWGTTKDNPDSGSHDELRKRQDGVGQVPDGEDIKNTWEGAIADWVNDAIKNGATPDDFGITQDDAVQAQGGLLLPDKYGRIFHPTRFAHMMIAENILRLMDLTKAQSMNKKAATTTLVGCPLPTGPASHDGQHNSCNRDSGDDGVTFKVSDANNNIKDFCTKHQGEVVESGPEGILETYPIGSDSMVLMASRDTELPCQIYPDPGKVNFWECSAGFGGAMNDCDTNTVDEKLGGTKTLSCISYSIRGDKGSGSTTSPPPSGPSRTCSLHLKQTASQGDGGSDPFSNSDTPLDYTVEVTVWDGLDDNKKQIGQHDDAGAGDGNPLSVALDGSSDPLLITPEKQNDYIQFQLGSEQWKSSDSGCSVGGWDPRQSYPADRQMDCSFSC